MSDGPFAPRLLSRLELAINAEVDKARADCLRADYAVQLARHGQVAKAQMLLTDLRRRHFDRPHNVVTVWINFAESWLEHYNGQGDAALMKMQRAHALAQSMEIIELQRLAAASLAYIHWNREDVDSAVHYLEQSLKNVGPHDYSILCRCGLVIGEILGMSRRNDLAQPWLSVARDSAMAAKDDASISALAFNLASVSLMLIRQSLLRESSRIESVSAAAFRVLASNNVDSTFGIPRDQLNAMHRARLYSLEGKLREAIAIYRHTPRGNLVSRDRQAAEWTSDEAWCYARLGDLSSALRLAHESEKLIVPGTQIDDLAAMHSRLGLIYKMSGDNQKRVSHESISRSLWLKYEEFQDHCLAAIERIDSPKKVLKWLS